MNDMDRHVVWSDKRRQAHQDLTSKGYKLMHDDEEKSVYHHSELGWHEETSECLGKTSAI